MWDVHVRCFYRAETNSALRRVISAGHWKKLSSAKNTLTNRTVNARFWLRKQIWEPCDMVMHISVCD